ncbi:hypothetical protein KO465_09580 [Candidatus Micrarchaeota archaeon]|jgi:hypothetical protein|nr:hypothetical protein [Candidatus Micrarchaeota archaeon]
MGIFSWISNLFGSGVPRRYNSLHKMIQGNIRIGSESNVKMQLENLANQITDEKQKKAFEKYIESGVWKKVFVKRE